MTSAVATIPFGMRDVEGGREVQAVRRVDERRRGADAYGLAWARTVKEALFEPP